MDYLVKKVGERLNSSSFKPESRVFVVKVPILMSSLKFLFDFLRRSLSEEIKDFRLEVSSSWEMSSSADKGCKFNKLVAPDNTILISEKQFLPFSAIINLSLIKVTLSYFTINFPKISVSKTNGFFLGISIIYFRSNFRNPDH